MANTVYQSASRTPDIQHLVPVSTQPPAGGRGRARPVVRMPCHVAPGLGLGQPEGRPLLARRDARKVAPLLLLGAGDEHGPGRETGEEQHQGGGVGVLGDLLDGDGEPEDARTGSAELLGEAQTEQVGVPEGLEEVVGVLAGQVDLPRPGPDLVLGEPADALLQRGEFRREVEVHGRRGYPARLAPAAPGPGRGGGSRLGSRP